MSPDPFVHLHVASGYSLQYGASHPEALVQRAAELEMDALALTDRDGTYGAVKFARACLGAGISPLLGVDLAHRPTVTPQLRGSRDRTPVRGGAHRDPRLPRVTLLASGRSGWASLCRLVSATHLAGERGRPVTTHELVAEHAAAGDLVVLLGPASGVGAALAQDRDDLAEQALRQWRDAVPAECLFVELVSHRTGQTSTGARGAGVWGAGSTPHAARMAGVASRAGVATVLSNAVRYADRLQAPVVDVLDAARRLVPLDQRHVDRTNAEGFLKSGKEMGLVAEEVARAAGEPDPRRLLARTRALADRCRLDPRSDLGLGEVHFPEFEVVSGGPATGRRVPGQSPADAELRRRCEGAIGWRYGAAPRQRIWKRLHDELETISRLGYASYFLTVADVTGLIKQMGVRAAARGSGAGSLVNYLLGISGIEPLRHDLLMERFLSPLRGALPDIDIDVESARRTEVYEAILDRFGGERCVCVSMMDSYRVRHAVRDVGAALGMPPGEIDAIAKAFPHIRARDARVAMRELPELRSLELLKDSRAGDFDLFFRLVEMLDGLPRHIAVHPCGVLLSDATLLDRTPVEASYAGFPMSQFDKDDVEDLGLLKLDVLGIRMQSAMAHAVAEIRRTDELEVDLDDPEQVPFEDPETYRLISSARTLGIFQIESPGQRELVGKSGIEDFEEIIADISLFRPGPVKSDMITPYLDVKQQWKAPQYVHPDMRPILRSTRGVVVFHEQVIELIACFAGVSFAEADEKRRALGDTDGMAETRGWFFPRALARGYEERVVREVWRILEGFASFGFCKAHAAAFALPTFQSAWLKTHWPAHFLSGVLTHDPGMYPKRLILADARQFGIEIRGLDVNASAREYVVEPVEDHAAGRQPYAIRLALGEVKGINDAEVARIVAGRPYTSLSDFWHRARVSRPVTERLVLAGAFDGVYAITGRTGVRGRVTRRDLLLQVAVLDQHQRGLDRASRSARGISGARSRSRALPAAERAGAAAARNSSDPVDRESTRERTGVWEQSSRQARSTAPPRAVQSVQLTLELGDEPEDPIGQEPGSSRWGESGSGLPEMTDAERMAAELEILGLDVSEHVVSRYDEFLTELGVVRSKDLLTTRSRSQVLTAGVKVATQTPPIRSGRRVIFLTLDDSTGPVDATFFEDVQGPYAGVVFGSWLLVVRGELRRTGPRGVSVRATGCWELPWLFDIWQREGIDAVHRAMAATDAPTDAPSSDPAEGAGVGRDQRRVLVHTSGFRMSPYSDIRPAGEDVRDVARKLWHRSPGSAG